MNTYRAFFTVNLHAQGMPQKCFIHYTMHFMHYILCTMLCAHSTAHCALCTVHHAPYTIYYTYSQEFSRIMKFQYFRPAQPMTNNRLHEVTLTRCENITLGKLDIYLQLSTVYVQHHQFRCSATKLKFVGLDHRLNINNNNGLDNFILCSDCYNCLALRQLFCVWFNQ